MPVFDHYGVLMKFYFVLFVLNAILIAGATALEEKRRYELEWKRLDILKEIASKGRKFVAGEQGEALLNSLVPGSEINNGHRRG